MDNPEVDCFIIMKLDTVMNKLFVKMERTGL